MKVVVTAMAAVAALSAFGQALTLPAGLTSELSVAPVKGALYFWELYEGQPADFATESGTCPGDGACFENGANNRPSVRIRWLRSGVYFYKAVIVTAEGCSNFKVGRIEVGNLTDTAGVPEIQAAPGTSSDGIVRFIIRLRKSTDVTIELFTAAGQLVDRTGRLQVGAGADTVIPVATRLPQGIYLYRIRTVNASVSGRVAVVPVY